MTQDGDTSPIRLDEQNDASTTSLVESVLAKLNGRPVVLVGMMGAGKTTVGRRLAAMLNRKFVDSDSEIEAAAGMDIPDIFSAHGEPEFRAGETRVISRILLEKDIILGTGGGAFMGDENRTQIKTHAVSIWLNAAFDLLFARVSRRSNRPLLQTPNPKETLRQLIEQRAPFYALSDITVTSTDVPHDAVARQIIEQLNDYLSAQNADQEADQNAAQEISPQETSPHD